MYRRTAILIHPNTSKEYQHMSIYKLNEIFNIAQWDDSHIDWNEIPDDVIKDDLKTGKLNPFFGKKHTKETLKKIGQASKEYSAKYGNPFKGKKQSAETREQMKRNHKGMTGQKHKPETIQKMKDNHKGMTGKKHSDISKKKIGKASSGENNGFYGKKHSEESRKRMSEVAKQRWATKKRR